MRPQLLPVLICIVLYSQIICSVNLGQRKLTAMKNLKQLQLKRSQLSEFIPGQTSPSFSLNTINGVISFPSPIFENFSIIFHAWNRESAFLEAMWYNIDAIKPLLFNSSTSLHSVMMSTTDHPKDDVLFMKQQIELAAFDLIKNGELLQSTVSDVLSRIHFVTSAVNDVTPWIGKILHEWRCEDHNCGVDYATITSNDSPGSLQLPRLDARYDWLPSPVAVFGNKTLELQAGYSGCEELSGVKGKVALVWNRHCSFSQVVKTMQSSGAVGVLVVANETERIQDMNCVGVECDAALNIPASMVDYNRNLIGRETMFINYTTVARDNIHFAIDRAGKLAEVGWLLYPSTYFYAWQSQWFDYVHELETNLSRPSTKFSLMAQSTMHGANGSVAKYYLPPLSELRSLGRLVVDMSLTCPGVRDTTCPHWDHTVQLFVCCDGHVTCDNELTRWISPFRRRIGRWLTDVTPLIPLMADQSCTFQIKTVPWAMPWVVDLNLLTFSYGVAPNSLPGHVMPLYQYKSVTFDRQYNSHFKTISFSVPQHTKQVLLYSVITGHGSDENQCGEFCITSHHFVINNKQLYNNTFSNAGTPLGCAERVRSGVEPNEHGTWLYGRDGWCDGSDVKPWTIDITQHLDLSATNNISYFGWFQGKDPDPKQNPGVMIIYAYLSFFD